MQGDDPPYLPVGTDVSAKYKGAFCEAKIKKVVRNIKCKVTFKGVGTGSATVTDEAIKGTLRVGNTVEVKHDQKKETMEAVITKIQDCSQYTVVFDDGDITTLRRSALCLKSGRHFAESETLDQLPLTHPEHFSTPVLGHSSGRRGRRGTRAHSDESDSDSESTCSGQEASRTEREPHTGRVVLVEGGGGGGTGAGAGERRRAQTHFPGLVVAPNVQETAKIKIKEEYLVRSFKDGRYYTVPKKEAREFRRGHAPADWGGVDAALQYLADGTLPPHWDRDVLFAAPAAQELDSDDSWDDEPREEKDHFVAQLYKFMDDRGTPLNRNPTIANKDIHLYRLFRVVQKAGGYNRVTNQNQWKSIASKMGFQPATISITNLCKQAYKKFLHSFEEFYRKLGVTLVAHPRGGRTPPSGRSLIRDRDRAPPVASPASPRAHDKEDKPISEPPIKSSARNRERDREKDREAEKERERERERAKEKELEKEREKECEREKEREREREREREIQKEKEREKEKEKECEKERERVKEREREIEKEREIQKEKEREKKEKEQEKELKKLKVEKEASDAEDSGDNQPLIPPIRSEKLDKNERDRWWEARRSMKRDLRTSSEKRASKARHAHDKVTLSKAGEKWSGSEAGGRRLTCERDKTSASRDKDTAAKKQPSTDSDSSSRGSRCGGGGGTTSRRSQSANSASSGNTSVSCSSNGNNTRKRKITQSSQGGTTKHKPKGSGTISAAVGDKLKVYYGPTHSEAKVTYEAKVMEVTGRGADTTLRVHYTGWNTRYDEWIQPARIAENLSHTRHPKTKHKDGASGSGGGGGGSKHSTPGKPRTRTSSARTPHAPHATHAPHAPPPNKGGEEPSDSDTDCDTDGDGEGKPPPKRLALADKPGGESCVTVMSPASPVTLREDPSGDRRNSQHLNEKKTILLENIASLEKKAFAHGALPSEKVKKNTADNAEGITAAECESSDKDVSEDLSAREFVESERSAAWVSRSASPVMAIRDDCNTDADAEALQGSADAGEEARSALCSKRAAPLVDTATPVRAKRPKLSVDDQTPKGRDFDLNEIRSELKGFEKAVKLPLSIDAIKKEDEENTITLKIPEEILKNKEQTPEKVTEDIYEFKEPEPFEFEARKSEEKKKRPPHTLPHRMFQDFPQFKLSPPSCQASTSTSTLGTSPQPYEEAFDKLYQSESYNINTAERQDNAQREVEPLSLFSDPVGVDSSGASVLETEPSEEPSFTYESDLFVDKSSPLPLFKSFTPAKNQETYSKRDNASKLADLRDEFNNSLLKDDQSSDEDPIHAAIERVNAHTVSDDANSRDGDGNGDGDIQPSIITNFSTKPIDTDHVKIKSESKDNLLSETDPGYANGNTQLPLKIETDSSTDPLFLRTKPSTLVSKTKQNLLLQSNKMTHLGVPSRMAEKSLSSETSAMKTKTEPQSKPTTALKDERPFLEKHRTESTLIKNKMEASVPVVQLEVSPNVSNTPEAKIHSAETQRINTDMINSADKFIDIVEKSTPPTKLLTKIRVGSPGVNKSKIELITQTEKKDIKMHAESGAFVSTVKLESDSPLKLSGLREKNRSISPHLDKLGPLSPPLRLAEDAAHQHLDGSGSFTDAVITERPAGFLLHKEGISIADKVLRAIAKKAASVTQTSPKKVGKLESAESHAPECIKTDFGKPKTETAKSTTKAESVKAALSRPEMKTINKLDPPKVGESVFGVAIPPLSPSALLESKLESPCNVGKNNKELNDTIQKLSSQICQPPPVPPPRPRTSAPHTAPSTPYPPSIPSPHSDPTDSDDSDQRLIIDKLSEEGEEGDSSDGAGGAHLSPSLPRWSGRVQQDRWASSHKQQEEDTSDLGGEDGEEGQERESIKDKKETEEDSNISLLLCEESIPGSPAPVDAPPAPARSLQMPFASAPSNSPPATLHQPTVEARRMSGAGETRTRVTSPAGGDGGGGGASHDHNASSTRDPPLSGCDSLADSSSKGDFAPSHECTDVVNPDKPLLGVVAEAGTRMRKASESSGGLRRGRRARPRSDSEDADLCPSLPSPHTAHNRPLKYNFYVELEPSWDCSSRIQLLTSRLAELRSVYHSVKAELAAVDRRRKKLRRKEREAVKAARAACGGA